MFDIRPPLVETLHRLLSGKNMPQLGQYYAFVTINGVAQPEYAPEYCPQGSSASCWIALEAEKVCRPH